MPAIQSASLDFSQFERREEDRELVQYGEQFKYQRFGSSGDVMIRAFGCFSANYGVTSFINAPTSPQQLNVLLLGGRPYRSATALQARQLTQIAFDRLAGKWKSRIRGVSSMTHILSDESYQELLTYREQLVPFILRDLKNSIAPWFSALRIITGRTDIGSQHRGQFRKMANEWIKWGIDEHII